MPINMEEIGILAQSRDNMLVQILASMVRPDFSKARLPFIGRLLRLFFGLFARAIKA